MIVPEHAHVCAGTRSAQAVDLRRIIVEPHEGDGTAGNAAGGADVIAAWAQMRKREAGASAALLNQGGIAKGTKDGLHGIFYGEDETAGQLPSWRAGIHQRGRIRQEPERTHQIVENLFGFLAAEVDV